MIEPPPPPPREKSLDDLLKKIVTFAAIGVGIGFGSCGFGAVLSAYGSFFGFLIRAGSVLFFVSLAALILTGIFWAIASVIRSFSK